MNTEMSTPNVEGFVNGPQVWRGEDMRARESEWTYVLNQEEIREIERAIEAAIASGGDIVDMTAVDFQLPTFAPALARLRTEILRGRGFVRIRGLPVNAYTRRESAIAFWGLGAHLGLAVSQNAKGHVLGHVKDLGLNYEDSNTRGYQTAARLPYHTDYADIVGLLCLNTAQSGGMSSVVSSVTLYNEMLKRRPDLVGVLARPFCRTRWGETDPNLPPWIEVPVFNRSPEGVVTTYVRSAVRKAQRVPAVPRLTDDQTQAMDMLDSLAADPELHLDMQFEVGDIQLLNNHWLMHSRTAYQDWPEPEKKRHLLRLWLACEDGPFFPPAMTESFQGLTVNGRPNGIHLTGVPFCAPLEA